MHTNHVGLVTNISEALATAKAQRRALFMVHGDCHALSKRTCEQFFVEPCSKTAKPIQSGYAVWKCAQRCIQYERPMVHPIREPYDAAFTRALWCSLYESPLMHPIQVSYPTPSKGMSSLEGFDLSMPIESTSELGQSCISSQFFIYYGVGPDQARRIPTTNKR